MGHPLPPVFLILLRDAGVELFVEIRRNGRRLPVIQSGPNRLLAVGELPAFRAFKQMPLERGLSWRIQGAGAISDDPVRIVLLACHKIKAPFKPCVPAARATS